MTLKEKRISEFEDRSLEVIQTEAQKNKRFFKKLNRT